MKPYDTEQDKKEQVREMFDRIAPAYDRLNHTLSFQIDKLWRRHVVRIVRRMQPRRILDVATGTGDLALAMARRMRGVQVLGVDLSENMLAEARRKATACGLDERQHPGSVTLRLLQIALSHNISQQYTTCTGNGKAEHRTDIAHYDDQ